MPHFCLGNSYGTAISTEKGELPFVKIGFSGSKKATKNEKGFRKHENSTFHKNATSMLGTALTTKDIAEQLSSQHEAEKLTRRKSLLKILSSVRYLARQGLPLRGDGNEKTFNFSDVTTDTSNREQLVICLRWVDDDLFLHEDFIGMQKVERIDSETIKSVIFDLLVRMNLAMQKCRGQCNDGCSIMAGRKGWVAAMIKEIEPRALLTHCYGHALNLACAETMNSVKL